MAAPRSIRYLRPHFVFKICETKPATDHKARKTQAWPGICFYGSDAGRVVWMEGPNGHAADTYYDGKEAGPLYSRESLDDDIAAADLVIAAIRSPEVVKVVASAGTVRGDVAELNDALKHVHAAMHLHTELPQDWLSWFVSRLAEVPALPPPKRKHRGIAKPKCACSRQQFATNLTGLKGPEITLLWRAHKTTHH
jgi:hypothetical protein